MVKVEASRTSGGSFIVKARVGLRGRGCRRVAGADGLAAWGVAGVGQLQADCSHPAVILSMGTDRLTTDGSMPN